MLEKIYKNSTGPLPMLYEQPKEWQVTMPCSHSTPHTRPPAQSVTKDPSTNRQRARGRAARQEQTPAAQDARSRAAPAKFPPCRSSPCRGGGWGRRRHWSGECQGACCPRNPRCLRARRREDGAAQDGSTLSSTDGEITLANLLVGQLGDVLGKLRHGPKVSCVLQRRGSPAAGADTQAPRSRRGTPDPWAPRAPRPARRGPLRGLHERLAPRAALAHAPRRPGSSAPSQSEDPSLHSGRGRQRARAKPAHEKRKVAGGAKGPAEDNTPIDRLGV